MCSTSDEVISRLVLDHFKYGGFHGCPSFCRLELIPLPDGRTVVIATELADNPGTSITNAAEILASFVCDQFRINPDRLVWIEHYGYGNATCPERSFDLVIFSRTYSVKWSGSIHFKEPRWQQMVERDWNMLGLANRKPVRYPRS